MAMLILLIDENVLEMDPALPNGQVQAMYLGYNVITLQAPKRVYVKLHPRVMVVERTRKRR